MAYHVSHVQGFVGTPTYTLVRPQLHAVTHQANLQQENFLAHLIN